MVHICVSNLTIIGSDNGLSPGRRQAITWTNVRILLIGPLGSNFIEMSIEIHTFSFKKIHLKMLSGKWRPFCLGLNVLRNHQVLLWAIVDWLTSYDTLWHCKTGSTLCQVMTCCLFGPSHYLNQHYITSSPPVTESLLLLVGQPQSCSRKHELITNYILINFAGESSTEHGSVYFQIDIFAIWITPQTWDMAGNIWLQSLSTLFNLVPFLYRVYRCLIKILYKKVMISCRQQICTCCDTCKFVSWLDQERHD